MKTLSLFAIIFSAFTANVFAQNTNPWPSIGAVGIGTTSPTSTLDVRSSAANGPLASFRVTGSWGGAVNQNHGISITGARYSSNTNTSLLHIGNDDSTSLFKVTDYGDLGIGTNSPSALIHMVKGVSPTLKIESNTNSNAYVVLKGGGTNSKSYEILSSGSGSYLNPGKFVISDGSTEVLTIKEGNVGINTIYPPSEYKFSVNGNMIAESVNVKLNTSWPDYVFQGHYTLRPLSELEKFIGKNHHLPEIPSASELRQNGFNLAEMDSKLLQKIEELTLYIIRQNKEIELIKIQNKNQQKEINRLKSGQ